MNLYSLTNGIGTFYVVANDPTEAKLLLESNLDKADYGFSVDREVVTVVLLTHEVTSNFNGKPSFCMKSVGNRLIIKDR